MPATPSFFKTHPRSCAVILASSHGSRLFPMTSSGSQDTSSVPKHLLPVAGIAPLTRLLHTLHSFPQIIITIAHDDVKTIEFVNQVATLQDTVTGIEGNNKTSVQQQQQVPNKVWKFASKIVDGGQPIYVVQLSEECFGSVDALRQVETTKIVHPSTPIVVFPGDIVFLTSPDETTQLLDPFMRPQQSQSQSQSQRSRHDDSGSGGYDENSNIHSSSKDDVACTVLLVDVLELDEHDMPLKESAKAKRGGLARDEEDIEYIGLSYESASWYQSTQPRSGQSQVTPRVVIKKLKIDVEADEDMTGSTFKLDVPKSLLRRGQLVVRTEWSDLHVYAFAPWVRKLIASRTRNISSIQEDLLPLLVSRQFQGQKKTLGKEGMARLLEDEQQQNNDKNDTISDDRSSSNSSSSPSPAIDDTPYSIVAVPLPSKTALRVNTISAFLFANKEAISKGSTVLPLPDGSKWNGKFQTLVLANDTSQDMDRASDGQAAAAPVQPTMGKKVQMKSSFVGKNCVIGDKCRLNNVIVLDNTSIGEQCSLQNAIIGYDATIGANSSLNDCQVGAGTKVPAQTKEKGEVFTVSDMLDDDGGGIL
mmetsp:Transcript_172/g.351  ORF Transcript_172/g.351 Transcript_172/m.351 type:complete len:589 (-) Transcript_172:63-1829(-)